MFTTLARFKVEQLGEFAVVIKCNGEAVSVAAHLLDKRLPGVTDVVPVFDDVAIYFNEEFDADRFESALQDYRTMEQVEGKHHRIPVDYTQGEDLQTVCDLLSLSESEFVALHSGRRYECRAIGFCPGFAYLGWLEDSLSQLGRRESPRVRVEPGSVAIAGKMTAVYPLLRPGGWWLIGKTPLTLVDVEAGYYPISVGDSVAFEAIDSQSFARLRGERL